MLAQIRFNMGASHLVVVIIDLFLISQSIFRRVSPRLDKDTVYEPGLCILLTGFATRIWPSLFKQFEFYKDGVSNKPFLESST